MILLFREEITPILWVEDIKLCTKHVREKVLGCLYGILLAILLICYSVS